MTYVGDLMEKNIENIVHIMVDDLFTRVTMDIGENGKQHYNKIDCFCSATFEALLDQTNQEKLLNFFYSFIDELKLLKSNEAKRLLRNKYLNRIKAFMSIRAFYAFIVNNV